MEEYGPNGVCIYSHLGVHSEKAHHDTSFVEKVVKRFIYRTQFKILVSKYCFCMKLDCCFKSFKHYCDYVFDFDLKFKLFCYLTKAIFCWYLVFFFLTVVTSARF